MTLTAVRAQFQRAANVKWATWRRLGGEVSTPTLQTDAAVGDLLRIPAGEFKSNAGLRAARRWADRGGDESLEAIEEGIAARTQGFSPEQLATMAADSPAIRRTLTEMAEARAAADLAEIPTANAVQELISELGQIQDTAQRTLDGINPTTAARQTMRIATIITICICFSQAAIHGRLSAIRAKATEFSSFRLSSTPSSSRDKQRSAAPPAVKYFG